MPVAAIAELSDAEEAQIFLFPDGKECIILKYFTDVTELFEYSLVLEQQKKRLEQISCEHKLLSYDAISAAREKELLLENQAA